MLTCCMFSNCLRGFTTILTMFFSKKQMMACLIKFERKMKTCDWRTFYRHRARKCCCGWSARGRVTSALQFQGGSKTSMSTKRLRESIVRWDLGRGRAGYWSEPLVNVRAPIARYVWGMKRKVSSQSSKFENWPLPQPKLKY